MLAAIRCGAACTYGLRRFPVSAYPMIESSVVVCAGRVVGQVVLVLLDTAGAAKQRASHVRANPTPVLFRVRVARIRILWAGPVPPPRLPGSKTRIGPRPRC